MQEGLGESVERGEFSETLKTEAYNESAFSAITVVCWRNWNAEWCDGFRKVIRTAISIK